MRFFRRRGGFGGLSVYGLMMLSMGAGMLLVILIPGWAVLLAVALIGLGGWLAFMC